MLNRKLLALRLTHIPAGSRTTYSSVLMTRHGALLCEMPGITTGTIVRAIDGSI
jgi:hypothetical protein